MTKSARMVAEKAFGFRTKAVGHQAFAQRALSIMRRSKQCELEVAATESLSDMAKTFTGRGR